MHREAFRTETNSFPSRYSRHYYDLYCMAQTPIKDIAFADIDLLKNVVNFKDKFYHCPWARYDLAQRGTMRLMPPEYNIKKLHDDYMHMQNMIFGNKPDFKTLILLIEQLENDINRI